MARLSPTYFKFGTQMLYVFMMTFTFVVFVLVYRPCDVDTFLDMGRGLFAFNVSILMCIVLGAFLITRMFFYSMRKYLKMTPGWYIFWCCCEVIVVSQFVTLYTCLMYRGEMLYLEALWRSLELIALITVFPYVIIGLSLQIVDLKRQSEEFTERRIRFEDDRGNVKLVVKTQNVLYISAEENYVQIYYNENNAAKSYALRNTMKNIEALCSENGLLRCHRSYYINKEKIKALRKERDGVIIAELDSFEKFHIPVSRRYYEELTRGI